MSKAFRYLSMAAGISREREGDKNYFLGGVGVRADGVLVFARNGEPKEPEPRHHCEFRLSRKMDVGGDVYVARTLADGSWARARPCASCVGIMVARGIRRCYYTIERNEFGCMIL